MRIDASGNVGINNSSPAATLHTVANSGTTAMLTVGASGNNIASFYTSGSSQVMTLDASGNLLIGKTSTSGSTAGHAIKPNGQLEPTVDGSYVSYFNRKTSDGPISYFAKDGTTVGSIGTNSGIPYFLRTSGGIAIGNTALLSADSSGAINDATSDLGGVSNRWKDLYLSGTAYSSALNVDGGSSGIINFGDVTSNYGRLYADSTGTYVGSVTANPLILRTTNTERMRIDSSGNLLVGTTDSTLVGRADSGRVCIDNLDGNDCLQLKGSGVNHLNIASWIPLSGGGYHIGFGDGTGSYTERGVISTDGSVTNYGGTSDYRLKENVIELTEAISRVKMLSPSRFNFIDKPEQTIDGFIAHEVQTVVPEAVVGEKDALKEDGSIRPQQLDNSKLVPLLTAALQEALEKIDNLESRLLQLESN
jgi:hypothetical protein